MSDAAGSVFRSKVRFVLDGDVIELDNVDPNRTVLQFLREDLRQTGTKEGCAEGDCGACTVVVADIDASGERIAARAINSCIQLLPTLDGKELLTVESLAKGDNLHPAQKAMVDCHGSQCGFCTPGFVMSLFALYKNNPAPSRMEIDDALAGNLCRCTGYRPIVAAATEMYRDAPRQGDWTRVVSGGEPGADEAERLERLKLLASDQSLCVTWQDRRFFSPRTVEELAGLLQDFPEATLLAGGTDAGLWITKQHRELATIIYTGNVSGIQDIGVTDSHIDIGAAVSLTDAMPSILKHFPSLTELFLRFASPPIRNAGTLGGNIANGSPIGDTMPALLALDASLVLGKGGERRTISLEDFYLAYRETALRPGEFIERIHIPLPDENSCVRSYKVSKRFDQDISAVCAAFRLRLNDNVVEEIRLAYGGMAETPRRARRCEEALRGSEWNSDTVLTASRMLAEDFTPITDMRSTARYRGEVCRNLLTRFLNETTGRKNVSVYSYGR